MLVRFPSIFDISKASPSLSPVHSAKAKRSESIGILEMNADLEPRHRDKSKLRMKEGWNLEIPVIEIFKTKFETILFQLNAVSGSAIEIPGGCWGSWKRCATDDNLNIV